MILLAHMLFGVAIGSYFKDPFLAILLAFFSHYLLDLLPHNEYSIKNISEKKWDKAFPDILKIALDFGFGIILISLFSTGAPIIFAIAFFAILPDGFSILSALFPNKFFALHDILHRKKIHFLKYKKISSFWRLATQAGVVIFSLVLMLI
ncbi:MAG: hypothetical protein Q8Q48_01950 [Candidatus Staskawiczbacteria bacterium]|nr:hypothetical protein [Candidatus Staskawiczbacteria bacterium]